MSNASKIEAINFIAKQMKQDPIKMITSNIGDIAKNIYDLFKNGVSEFKDDVKNIGLKNKDDINKDKKISTNDIDIRKTRFGCIFDLDDGKKILEVAKKFDTSVKQAPKDCK